MREEKNYYLKQKACELRRSIVDMCYYAGPEHKAHPGPALSIADIITVLYFEVFKSGVFNKNDKAAIQNIFEDKLILSKGHACPAIYAALFLTDKISLEQLKTLRRAGSNLQGHPDMKKTPGVDMTTGSLGNGLAAGVGMALSKKIDKKPGNVFVVLGDGECQEGLIWEAALVAPKYRLNNLIAIVDQNGWQSCDTVQNTIDMSPFAEKWCAFNWNVIKIDGHNIDDIISAFSLAKSHCGGPTVIIAKTIKGKGVSFMEGDNSWHQRPMTKEQYLQAVNELGGCKGEQ